MILPEPTEVLDAEARLLICLEHLAEVLALALALERDPILRVAVVGAGYPTVLVETQLRRAPRRDVEWQPNRPRARERPPLCQRLSTLTQVV